jgi:hypothetical protein
VYYVQYTRCIGSIDSHPRAGERIASQDKNKITFPCTSWRALPNFNSHVEQRRGDSCLVCNSGCRPGFACDGGDTMRGLHGSRHRAMRATMRYASCMLLPRGKTTLGQMRLAGDILLQSFCRRRQNKFMRPRGQFWSSNPRASLQSISRVVDCRPESRA